MKNMNIITLNCQKAYNPASEGFFKRILQEEAYDFLILQEANISVLKIIDGIHSAYKIVHIYDADFGADSHQCILYREQFILKDSSHVSFAKFVPKVTPHSWGFLSALFTMDEEPVVIGSAHLHPGIKPSIRMKELKIIKDTLGKYADTSIIIAGDFNTGFPWEISRCEAILSPELIRVSRDVGSTLDSMYTEKGMFIGNKVATFLARLGISIKLCTDNVYVSRLLAETKQFTCKKLPDRVSDHSAVECRYSDTKVM